MFLIYLSLCLNLQITKSLPQEKNSSSVGIAIFPFENLTLNSQDEIFCQSFNLDLTTELSRIRIFHVLDQHSLETIEINSKDFVSAITDLNTDYYLIGSFRSIKERFRINIQLFQSRDRKLIWGDRFEGNREDIFEIQEEILQRVVANLQQQLNYNLLNELRKKPKSNLQSYEYWLYGMEEIEKGSPESDLKAREMFTRSANLDPASSLALSGISLSYFNEWSCQLWDRWDISKKGAYEYALKAIELDENNYLALMILGRSYLYMGEYEKAEHMLRKSIHVNPNDTFILAQVAFWLSYLECADEAVEIYEHAINLNPLHKEAYNSYGATIFFEAGDFEKALMLAKKVDINKSWVDFSMYVAAMYFHLKDFDSVKRCWTNYLLKFEEKIFDGKGELELSAFNWHKTINPYKGKSHLYELWDYLESEDKFTTDNKTASHLTDKALFAYRGDTWEFNYYGERAVVKSIKGYADIQKLLQKPNEEIHCTALMDVVLEETSSEISLDQKAKTEYQIRIKELNDKIEEAQDQHDYDNLEKLQVEYDQLLDYLSSSLGLAGKSRKVGSNLEKARTAVTWRIRNAIKKLEPLHPQLAKHLSRSVKTGTMCSYKPEVSVNWEF